MGGGLAPIFDGVESGQRAPVLEVPHSPERHNKEQCRDGRAATAGAVLTCADLLRHHSKKPRQHQGRNQHRKYQRLNDEDDVPGIPLAREGIERADAVVIGEVQQNVGEPGDAGKQIQPSPAARGRRGQFVSPAAALPEASTSQTEANHQPGDDGDSKKRVGDAAMLMNPQAEPLT